MDARGNVTAMQLGNGVDVIATYEPASGRLDRLDAWDGAIKIQDVDYLFDVLGNLKERHDQSAGANLKEIFGYDTLNRLKTVDLSVNGTTAVTTLSLTYYESGNIHTKSDVGTYLYSGAQPHAVSSAGGVSYSYDANGNQTSGDGRAILYTVFDMPYTMSKGNDRVDFAYGVGNSRYQREDFEGGVLQKTTLYLGSTERITENGSTFFKRYLGGVAIATWYPSTGVQQLAYLLKDHIGSIHTVLNESGAITASMHFSAFGQRQDADWQTPLTGYLYASELLVLNDITTRGFTGHEQVDSMGIIHMNGRIYDPKLGRFLQADPVVQAPKNSQSLNRYSYVFNNPLSYTDPSGYFIEGLMKATGMWATHKFFNRVPFLNAAVSVGLNYVPYCQVWCSALWNANSNYVATGSLSSAFKSGVITAATSYAMGEIANSPSLGVTQKLVAVATVGGIAAELQGGKFGHGFLSAGVGYQMGTVTGGPVTPGRLLAVMIVGGTVSEITGGKFANGAATAGFAYVAVKAAGGGSRDLSEVNARDMTEAEYASVMGTPEDWYAWQWGDPLPPVVSDGLVGWADSVLFGFGDELRSLAGIDGGINYASASYRYAGYAGVVGLGGGRLAYAGVVRGYSMIARSGAAASGFRTGAGNFFRFGTRRPYQPHLSGYTSDAALRAAAGRTNPYVNSLGVTHVVTNVYNLEVQGN